MIYNNIPMGLTSKFTGGKHKGETLAEVINKDKSYIRWALSTIRGFNLNNEAGQRYQGATYEKKENPFTKLSERPKTLVEIRKEYLKLK